MKAESSVAEHTVKQMLIRIRSYLQSWTGQNRSSLRYR